MTQPRKPWLVSGIIREGTTVFLSGREGVGKSIVALELAACVAGGREFFGNAVSQGEVVYVAAERGDSQRERLEALRDAKGVNPDCINFIDYQFKFNHKEDKGLFLGAVAQNGIKPKLIIIDTLRASFDGDENSSANAQATMDAFTRIRRHFDATIIVLHHVNAFGQSRGSSAFLGAADTELYVTNSKRTGKVFLTVRKQNNGKTWTKFVLSPQLLEFGNDYSSIVLNLDGTELLDAAPEEDDEETSRDTTIVTVIDSHAEPVSLNRLHKDLAQIEGKARNKNSLKEDVKRLAEQELITFTESGNTFLIGSVGV
ncbi:MAG: AAA family ATPase [Thermomicrobiales bacterium]